VIYVAFWMALAMMFSIFFRRIATSALAVIAVWIFFAFFMSMIAGLVANSIAPVDEQTATENPALVTRHDQIERTITLISPTALYTEASGTILTPTVRSLSPFEWGSRMLANPLPLGQSLILVWPHIISLIALAAICFAISYVRFMRQEIRSP
jgi:ABC-2 type transport system permease protein